MMLLGLGSCREPTPCVPSPAPPRTSSDTRGNAPIVDVGFELFGVPFGVPFGVDDALSTLAFLDPDLGVTFELKKALTGVAMSSFGLPGDASCGTVRPSRLSVGDP